jgi:hypothetical protein
MRSRDRCRRLRIRSPERPSPISISIRSSSARTAARHVTPHCVGAPGLARYPREQAPGRSNPCQQGAQQSHRSRAQRLLPGLLCAFGGAPLETLPFLRRQLPRVDRKILFVNPAHRGVHQIGGRDERVPSARTTARTCSYGRASSTMLKGPCAARRTWRKPPPSFSTSVNFASPAWAPRASPTSCASDVGTQIMVEAL